MDPILASLDRAFRSIDSISRKALDEVAEMDLFRRPLPIAAELTPFSVGEYILRSAAMVEKTFGGITTRLWDDPFEWTLPEKLSTKTLIYEYLDEVEATRAQGMAFIGSDASLTREIPSPEKLRPLVDILLECLARASHYQGRAFAVRQSLDEGRSPKL